MHRQRVLRVRSKTVKDKEAFESVVCRVLDRETATANASKAGTAIRKHACMPACLQKTQIWVWQTCLRNWGKNWQYRLMEVGEALWRRQYKSQRLKRLLLLLLRHVLQQPLQPLLLRCAVQLLQQLLQRATAHIWECTRAIRATGNP